MALLKSSKKHAKRTLTMSVMQSVIDEVDQYCKFAEIATREYFFTQAAELVFKKDKEWQKMNAAKNRMQEQGE